MCIAPVVISVDGRQTFVACRNCWQCLKSRVHDLVGRCIAESETSDDTVAVTLTYSGDVVENAVFVYADVQRFFKRLRRDGIKVRYVVAGEYGSRRGRVHWHAILFIRGRRLNVPIGRRIDWPYWTDRSAGRGFVYFQRPDYSGFAYVLKYVLKDKGARVSESVYSLSKKPPIGYEWFMEWADLHVRRRLAPQSWAYSFRDQFDHLGRRHRFVLSGRMRELFVERFLSRWAEVYGTEGPSSEVVELVEDRRVRGELAGEFDARAWARRLDERRPRSPRVVLDDSSAELRRVVSYVPIPEAGDLLVVRYEDGSAELLGEDYRWQARDAAALAAQLEAIGLRSGFRPLRSPRGGRG